MLSGSALKDGMIRAYDRGALSLYTVNHFFQTISFRVALSLHKTAGRHVEWDGNPIRGGLFSEK